MARGTYAYEKVERIGSAEYFLSEDKKYFRKKVKDDPDILIKEYNNLKKLHEESSVDDLNIIEPVGVSEQYLTTKYVEAASLLENLSPERYREFGEILRKFHECGHTHSHLQFNDVLYDGDAYYLTDLTHLDEREQIYDLVVPKVGLDAFKLKRPWRWREYERCFRRYLEGYGHDKFDHEEFKQVYKEALQKRVQDYKTDSALNWKYYGLNVMKFVATSPV